MAGNTTRPIEFWLSALLVWAVGIGVAEGAEPKAQLVRPPIIRTLADYRQELVADPQRALVSLQEEVEGVHFDIRYAGVRNFAHRPLYASSVALGRRGMVRPLRAVQSYLERRGYSLLIWDAYRPYRVTEWMWHHRTAPAYFFAPPWIGSRHNRGAAVDATMIENSTGRPVEMPTDFDEFTPHAFSAYAGGSQKSRRSRLRLHEAMQSAGFTNYKAEWWHFDAPGWASYSLLDLPAESVVPKP